MLPAQGRLDGVAVESSEADHDHTSVPCLVRPPRPVEMMCHAPSHALDDEPHWLALDRRKALDAQDAGSLSQAMRRLERRAVVDALERSGWVQARAAKLLGISERSMWYRVKKLGLTPPAR